MDYTNLQNKTVFDLCDDMAILKKILPALDLGATQKDCENLWATNKEALAVSFLNLAEKNNDKELAHEVSVQFKDVLNSFYNE